MQMIRIKKSLSLFLCTVLIAAMALVTTGCNDNKNAPDNTSSTVTVSSEVQASSSESDDVTVLGEGKTEFFFNVTDQDGKETKFEIHTDKTTVGEALLELELIAGEDSSYGIYVKTVNGITVDYDKDGKYWAFYINGEYASTGVDSTPVKEGETYSFKVE